MPQSRAQKRGESAAGLEESPYEDLVCFNFYRGWRSIQEYYAPAFPEGYGPQRGYVVGLCMDQPATISEIAAALQIDDAAISNLVRRMEADGLLKKVRSPGDGRSVEIVATAHAIEIEHQTRARLAKLDAKLAKKVTPSHLKVVKEVSLALREAANSSTKATFRRR